MDWTERLKRQTRGNRAGKVVAEEGDDEFWGQEFFAEEEEAEEDYEMDAEEARAAKRDYRVDADFWESEVRRRERRDRNATRLCLQTPLTCRKPDAG